MNAPSLSRIANLSSLSGPKLLSRIATLETAARDATRAAINAGLGSVRFNDMRQRAELGCPVAQAVVDTWDAESEAKAELEMRRKYHGGDSPVRRAA